MILVKEVKIRFQNGKRKIKIYLKLIIIEIYLLILLIVKKINPQLFKFAHLAIIFLFLIYSMLYLQYMHTLKQLETSAVSKLNRFNYMIG
jgi:hypothetical protein